MPDPLTVSIGIGLVVGLLLSEAFGLVAGGLVAPGYVALHLNQPWTVAATFAAALATQLIVELLSTFIILFGKRRLTLTVLVGYLVGGLTQFLLAQVVPAETPGAGASVIGHIVPGLIAIWIDRQGVIETVSSLLIASVLVRLLLILVFGHDLAW